MFSNSKENEILLEKKKNNELFTSEYKIEENHDAKKK